ncbi:hypothetical protein E2F47_06120 [Mycobacterium eburneum]|nr:hypothetical protein [Mycobacterium eburneum]TDH56703.1 hypothetical protein E2F47_06120 [Mycobacterium eburneum]
MLPARPGDVLAVASDNSLFAKLIRLGARLQGKPDIAGHVVIITHQDPKTGAWMGVQGQPGGVGPVDVTRYLKDRRTRSNNAQPRDSSKLAVFLAAANKAAGIPYDWVAIGADACDALGLDAVADALDAVWDWPTVGMPNHVVCSSLAAALYRLAGWQHPYDGDERNCTPADWWVWSNTQAWRVAPRTGVA